MVVDHMQRRMAAILAADAAGYSRLIGIDEAATVAALKAHRTELIDASIADHQGRIVKLTGDGWLAEFPSVVNAVTCAEQIQRRMRDRNADVPAERRIEFRMGINLGDVIVDGDDILGDGVNVAARLEGIAQPGEIVLSGTVREHIGNRLDFAFDDMGEQELKNIARPVRAYRLRSTASNLSLKNTAAGLDDRPSVAVLPFENMSGDAEQEYFADGVVEDLITALSRFKSFSVIARNSSFIYKGRPIDVRQVAKELGVRYVLEGSVRRSGSRLRITAQLVDGVTGGHLWADKFDGPVEDIFDMQDKITESVVAVVEPQIQQAEIKRSRRERPESLAAYDLYLQAIQKLALDRPDDNAAALELLEKAIALEPGYALALANAAYGYEHRVSMGWPAFGADDAKRSLQLARGSGGCGR